MSANPEYRPYNEGGGSPEGDQPRSSCETPDFCPELVTREQARERQTPDHCRGAQVGAKKGKAERDECPGPARVGQGVEL
jgi:hypothetical protein